MAKHILTYIAIANDNDCCFCKNEFLKILQINKNNDSTY